MLPNTPNHHHFNLCRPLLITSDTNLHNQACVLSTSATYFTQPTRKLTRLFPSVYKTLRWDFKSSQQLCQPLNEFYNHQCCLSPHSQQGAKQDATPPTEILFNYSIMILYVIPSPTIHQSLVLCIFMALQQVNFLANASPTNPKLTIISKLYIPGFQFLILWKISHNIYQFI